MLFYYGILELGLGLDYVKFDFLTIMYGLLELGLGLGLGLDYKKNDNYGR